MLAVAVVVCAAVACWATGDAAAWGRTVGMACTVTLLFTALAGWGTL